MDCSELTHAHFQALLRLARSSAGSGRASLPGLTAIRSFHTLRLAPPPALADGFCIPLVPPQSVPLHPAGTRLVIEGVCARADSGYNEDDSYLSLDRLSGPLLLRSWRPGDVFQPSGAPAPVRVKDLFQEARTPLWDRPFWPMISQGETIVWMRGYGSAERFALAAGAPGAWRVYETVEEIPSR
jgi:tRNA(Ile)-lysidine synthase